jgi:hypothetical protein
MATIAATIDGGSRRPTFKGLFRSFERAPARRGGTTDLLNYLLPYSLAYFVI